MKNLVLILITTLSITFLSGQSNFIEGLIIDKSGKEINGFINYRNWVNNPNQITFKKTLTNSSEVNYRPEDIKSFAVDDEKYISAIVDKETTSTSIGSFDDNKEFNLVRDTVFLQILVEGENSLYYLTENSRVRNFFLGRNDSIELLGYKKYYQEVNNKRKIFEIRQYRNQLARVISSCPKVLERTQTLRYKKSEMQSVFLSYYECNDDEVLFLKKVKKSVLTFGVYGGLSLTKLNFVGASNFKELVTAEFSLTPGYTLGTFFELTFPRNENRLSLKTGLNIFGYSAKSTSLVEYSDTEYVENEYDLSYNYLRLTFQLKYKIFKGSFDLFLSGGLSGGYTLNSTNFNKTTSFFFGDIRVRESKAVRETRIDEYSWLAGFGIEKGKFGIEILHEQGSGMSNFIKLDSNLIRYHVLLNYRF